MGLMLWHPGGGFSNPPLVRNPRLSIRCEYPDMSSLPTEVTGFCLRLPARSRMLSAVRP